MSYIKEIKCEGFKELICPDGKFDLYEITIAKHEDKIIILSERKVISFDSGFVEKYIEKIANDDFEGEWKWNKKYFPPVYEQVKGAKYIVYERLSSIANTVLVD